ncbi:MAG: transglutaminase-like domain-containing protein [Lachnospiraceae bacterium]|nr:transglutaminase-like domain-containing protein [Ruminococcus sp.]MCM1274896.1 transglutaminase-like domain-containing protein [Lachnospiraceae bacterium]
MKKGSKPIFGGAELFTSLIYLCALSAGLMYVLCRDYVFVCTVIMTALSFGMYMIFYALRRKKGFSLLAFVLLSLIVYAVCAVVVGTYGSLLFEFVFGASEFFDPVLAGVSILLCSFIVSFPVCYFSTYLPRPSFLLLPLFVPLILGARLLGKLPLGLLVFMAAGYMVAALGIARPEYPADNAYVDDKRSRFERAAAIGAAGVIAAALLTVIPRSDYTPMGRYMNSLANISAYGGQALSEFTESSVPNTGNNTPSNNALFMVYADFPRNVSRWSFDVYEGSDGWTFNGDFSTGYDNWQRERSILNADKLISDLRKGAGEGKLEKYSAELGGLGYVPYYSEPAKMTIRVVDGSATSVVMHPSETIGATVVSSSGETPATYRNSKDEIFTKRPMQRNAAYVVDYFYSQPHERFLEMLESVDFGELLNDAVSEGVIERSVRDAFIAERDMARAYLAESLDDSITPEIRSLAEEITAGLSNDCEKALAIEKWFGEAGFVYDLSFVPERSEADYFMFESRRGICSDFATASTLLLRAAGIPARYTEGFVLSDEARDAYGRYVVTGKYAHAYSTAYIEGYGWLEIDGTKYAPVDSLGDRITRVLTVIIIIGVVLAAAVIIFRRQLSALFFSAAYRLKSRNGKIRAVYLKTRALACRIAERDPKSATAEEVRDIISRTLSLDKEAREITDAANALFYGSGAADVDVRALYRDYKAIRRMKRSRKK